MSEVKSIEQGMYEHILEIERANADPGSSITYTQSRIDELEQRGFVEVSYSQPNHKGEIYLDSAKVLPAGRAWQAQWEKDHPQT